MAADASEFEFRRDADGGSGLPAAVSFVTLQLNFAGRVQGVGFRATSAELARRFPVSGWVRNLADGTVEMLVSGAEAGVEEFVAAVRNRFGRSLTGVTCRKIEPPQQFTDFQIRY